MPLDPTHMMKQATMTVADYLDAAVGYIDAKFGDGYAKDHPELVGAFLTAAATDFHTAMATNHAETLSVAIRAVADSLAEADS